MEHLALEVFDLATTENPNPTGSQYVVLEPDATITITESSEVFADGDVWSYDFKLNVHTNAHLFGTAGDIHGSRLHEQINKRKARLWVDGAPLYLGYLKLGDEAEVDAEGNVNVSFESGQKMFEEMIEGAKANQVPMMSDVLIGMALWRKRWINGKMNLLLDADFETQEGVVVLDRDKNFYLGNGSIVLTIDGDNDASPVQKYPRLVFPKGRFASINNDGVRNVDCVNTDTPYDDRHPYCNVALCYQKQGYEKKQKNGTYIPVYSEEPEAQRGYEYMPANRINSAPNFFVLYWIDCLMKHLSIEIDENQMKDVEDFKRLFFVNTACNYYEQELIPGKTRTDCLYRLSDARIVPEYFNEKPVGDPELSYVLCENFHIDLTIVDYKNNDWALRPVVKSVKVSIKELQETENREEYISKNRYVYDAIATSECFPNVSISEVISSIEGGFGVRLLFSNDYKRVRIVLLRNVFRNEEVQGIACEIVDEDVKVENNIRGFRMTYGNTEDTYFYYKGFADRLPHIKTLWPDTSDTHDYSKWKLNAKYADIINKVSAFDKTCYVTANNGNSYIIKVDKDAKRYDDLHPSLFEGAGFMDAEDGDCTGEEETIKTITVNFNPAIMNDLNMDNERDGHYNQRFALFVDETMGVRRPDLKTGVDYNNPDAVYDLETMYSLYGGDSGQPMTSGDGIIKPGEFVIASDAAFPSKEISAIFSYYVRYRDGYHTEEIHHIQQALTLSVKGCFNGGYRLYLQDNYKPNDDGISPIETHDWGLTLGIMRGSGSDAYVNEYDDPDDDENNAWKIVPGSSVTAHPDTCDNYGNEWDYNGDAEGIGDTDGRVSLKLRAEKPNPYFDPKQPESDSNRRYLQITNNNLQGRGLCDQFYKEYSYWIRNARIVKRTVRMTLAQLLTIDKTKRVRVGDVTGFIRKMQYSVSNQSGLGTVTMEIMYI